MIKANTIKLGNNLSLLVDIAKDINVKSEGDSSDKIIKTLLSYKKLMIKATVYLTFNIRVAFTQLRKVFIKATIIYHFNPEYYIQLKINLFGYAIS